MYEKKYSNELNITVTANMYNCINSFYYPSLLQPPPWIKINTVGNSEETTGGPSSTEGGGRKRRRKRGRCDKNEISTKKK